MILDTVLATIRRHAMLEPGDRVIVALSGGPDSVALLHILLELGDRLPLSIVVAHLDHGLRGDEAGEDAAFSAALAERLGLSFVAGQADVAALARREKRSLEEAGRLARRRFLREAAGQTGARRVALGHHRDDQAESVLLRLIGDRAGGGWRGSGPWPTGSSCGPCSTARGRSSSNTCARAGSRFGPTRRTRMFVFRETACATGCCRCCARSSTRASSRRSRGRPTSSGRRTPCSIEWPGAPCAGR